MNDIPVDDRDMISEEIIAFLRRADADTELTKSIIDMMNQKEPKFMRFINGQVRAYASALTKYTGIHVTGKLLNKIRGIMIKMAAFGMYAMAKAIRTKDIQNLQAGLIDSIHPPDDIIEEGDANGGSQ